MNDLYEAGLQNDNLNIIYKLNKNNKVAVITPHGLTERVQVERIVMQGENFAPLECSVQVDTFGKECVTENKYLFKYRGSVEIPPLSMVDDLLCISECGFKTTMAHAYMTLKTDTKKLQFGSKKCKKLHVGKYCEEFKCQSLKVDKWEEVELINEETGINEIEDVSKESEIMEEKTEEKLLWRCSIYRWKKY